MRNQLLLLALAFVAGCSEEVVDEEEEGESTSNISGGAASSAQPAVGALVGFDAAKGVHFCTGFLITPRIVMTAGHCTSRPERPVFYTGAGQRLAKPPTSAAELKGLTAHAISKELTHASYKGGLGLNLSSNPSTAGGTMRSDYGLYLLAAPVTITPLALAAATPAVKTTCTAIGYGFDTEVTGSGTGALAKRAASVTTTDLGASFIEVARGSGEPEEGDSGGPLICGGKVAGVFSFHVWTTANKALDRNFYAITTAPTLKSWINSAAKTWGVAGI